MTDVCPASDTHLGASVQEKTGGPTMYVIAVHDLSENHLVQCVWHDETNEVVVGSFKPEDLVGIPTRQIQ